MSIIIKILYSFLVLLGDAFIYIAKFFSPKIKLLVEGRQNTWKTLEGFKDKFDDVVWVHCASLGEFEQGRPLIERIKTEFPNNAILLSFYSPSGYEIMKNYPFADAIIYLPSDLRSNNIKLLKLIKPKICIFVKYEFWWNLIELLISKKVKLYLISGIFRESDYFFKPYFSAFSSLLKSYDHLFVQDENSAKILEKQGIYNFNCVGDTRIDRVIQRSNDWSIPKRLENFCFGKTVFVYGSVWIEDIWIIKLLIEKQTNAIHILAPHDISKSNIDEIRSTITTKSELFSDSHWNSNVIIINNIGLLSSLYKLAKYAYVGGGFKKGIHNILEPAVFKIPVFFGPNYKKFNEATELTKRQLCFSVNYSYELVNKIDELELDGLEYNNIASGLDAYFTQNQGATEKIMSAISLYLKE
jgi:3-deoxy-D-manno-octulosonic-acid transferase